MAETHRHFLLCLGFFFSSRRRHTRFDCDWSSDVCSSDLMELPEDNKLVEQDVPLRNALNEVLRDEYVKNCQRAVDRWNRTLRSEERRVGKECRCRWGPGD